MSLAAPCQRAGTIARSSRPSRITTARFTPYKWSDRSAQNNRVLRCQAEAEQTSAAAPAAAPAPVDPVRLADLIKGNKTILAELSGLDFSRAEVVSYTRAMVRLPKKYADVPLPAVQAVVAQLVAGKGADEMQQDTKALEAAQAMLSDLWRWRRRGGGARLEEGELPHMVALEELQNVTAPPPQNIDKVSSVLLDQLDLSEADKKQLGGAMQGAAMGWINSFVWGSMAAGVGLLVFFNWARSG